MGLKRLFSFLDFRASKQKEEEYEKLKKREGLEYINIGNLIFGSFFIIFSAVLVDFFLPFFLRDLGLSILEIGAYLTIGLALGTMFMTILFSQIQRNIALRSGLNYSTVFGFITSFVLYILPNTFGAILSSFSLKLRDITFDVSRDVTFHHNTREGTRRIVSSNYLIIQSIGFVLGLLFSLAFIKTLGFRNTFLIFAFLALPAFLIFSKIKEGTRFRPKINYKQPPVSRKLKLFLFSGIIYNFALSASFVLVITFLVTDYFSNSIEWIAYLYVGLYVSMGISSFITKKFLDKFSFIATAIFGMFIIFCSAIVIIFFSQFVCVTRCNDIRGNRSGHMVSVS